MTTPKINKWHPLKRMREWDGRHVRLLVDLRNKGGQVIRAGEVCRCVGAWRGTLNISARYPDDSTEEERNGSWWRSIHRVSISKVELIP